MFSAEMYSQAAQLVSRAFADGLRPEPRISVSEWADQYRIVAKPSPEPGRWKTSRVPYAREIMDRLSPSDPCEIVALMKAAQGAGTEIGLNAIGCWMHRYPDSTMIVQPTVDLAKKFSRTRFDRIVEATKVLQEIVAPPRRRGSNSSTFLKEFGPGRDSLVFTGANSAAGLRSYPSRFVLADELDSWETDLEGEGSPVDLLIQRTAAYANRKIFLLSTPTLEEFSNIHRWYKAGDQALYHVPCPLCRRMQTLIFGADRAARGEPGGFRWPKGEPDKVQYQCEHCGDKWDEWRKVEILERGEWIAEAPGNGGGKIRSYHIWAAYYPYGWPGNAWPALAAQWQAVHKEPTRLKTFVNLKLGEPWKDPTEAKADTDVLLARLESYGPELPPGVAVLTVGGDVQGNRIEAELVGWGRDEESWSIDYRVFPGDPARPIVLNADGKPTGVWAELDAWLKGEWLSELGVALRVHAVCIDSGYQQEIVRKFCHERNGRRIWATKGMAGHQRPAWPLKQRTKGGRLPAPFIIGVDTIKEVVYARLKIMEPGAGFSHFPRLAQYDREYFDMLTAEVRVPDYTGPVATYAWRKKTPGARNEALDCRGNAYAALQGLGITTALRLNREVDALKTLAEATARAKKDGVRYRPPVPQRQVVRSSVMG